MCRTFFTKYLPNFHFCSPVFSLTDVCKDRNNQTAPRSAYGTWVLSSVRQKPPQNWVVAPQRATVILCGPITIKATGRTQGQGMKQSLWGNAGLFQALTTSTCLGKWTRSRSCHSLRYLACPRMLPFLSLIPQKVTTHTAISCTAVFCVSWIFPFRKTRACILILYSHCCPVYALSFLLFVLFWVLGVFLLVGFMAFKNIWYRSKFSFAFLFSLYFLHPLLLKMCPHFIENKSPSYFLFDCQDFSFKTHWPH